MAILFFEMNAPDEIPEYEPPNRASHAEVQAYAPSSAPPGGEDRFLDTGGTMSDFSESSKQVAKLLKHV